MDKKTADLSRAENPLSSRSNPPPAHSPAPRPALCTERLTSAHCRWAPSPSGVLLSSVNGRHCMRWEGGRRVKGGVFFLQTSLQSHHGRPQLLPGSSPLLRVSLFPGSGNSSFLLPLQAQDSEDSSLLLVTWNHTILCWFLYSLPVPL